MTTMTAAFKRKTSNTNTNNNRNKIKYSNIMYNIGIRMIRTAVKC